jgi:hypothetical protein
LDIDSRQRFDMIFFKKPINHGSRVHPTDGSESVLLQRLVSQPARQ